MAIDLARRIGRLETTERRSIAQASVAWNELELARRTAFLLERGRRAAPGSRGREHAERIAAMLRRARS